jgi:hypothetical protein
LRAYQSFPAPPGSLIGNYERKCQLRAKKPSHLQDVFCAISKGTELTLHLFRLIKTTKSGAKKVHSSIGNGFQFVHCAFSYPFMNKTKAAARAVRHRYINKNFNGLSQDGGRVNFAENLRTFSFNEELLDETTFNQIYLTIQFLELIFRDIKKIGFRKRACKNVKRIYSFQFLSCFQTRLCRYKYI